MNAWSAFAMVLSLLCASVAHGVGLSVLNARHNYIRGEVIMLRLSVQNDGDQPLAKPVAACSLSGLFEESRKISDIAPRGKAEIVFDIPTEFIRSGDYEIRTTLKYEGGGTEALFPIYIAPKRNPMRYPVIYWGGSASMMDWGIERGFNVFGVGMRSPFSPQHKNYQLIRDYFEKSVKLGVDMLIYFSPMHKQFRDHPEALVIGMKGTPYERVIKKGRPPNVYPCPNEPYVINYCEEVVRTALAELKKYPTLRYAMLNSEICTPVCFSERCRQRAIKATGLDPLKFPGLHRVAPEGEVPENGIVEDDNPFYRFYRWWWIDGQGDVAINERMGKLIKKIKPEIVTYFEPYRLAPLYHRHRGLDCIATWTYTFPDTRLMTYTEVLIAGAKPKKQKVIQIVTTWEYDGWLAPREKGPVNMPRDIVREVSWIALSRRPDALCYYISSYHNPNNAEKRPFNIDLASYDEIGRFVRRVLQPYGAMILKLERVPRRAAFLCSAASYYFREKALWRGWVMKSVMPFYCVVQAAHIPTDFIFDETIEQYGLKDYDILFLPQCEALTRSIYERILSFARRGGIVIADSYLKPAIPSALKVDFDFSYWSKIDADAVLNGNGITADEHRARMKKYATELRNLLDRKVKRYVDSNSDEVLFNVLKKGAVRYVFVINDKRTYGERFGQWKTYHEKGVPQTVRLRLRTEGKPVRIYDLLRGKEITHRTAGQGVEFDLQLGGCDGTILAVYPVALAAPEISAPERATAGKAVEVKVRVADERGGTAPATQPLRIKVIQPDGEDSEYSHYTATEEGRYSFVIPFAGNDPVGDWRIEVTDLTTRLTARKTITLQRAASP